MTRTAADQDVFRAVADGSRRTLLETLALGSRSFQELHAELPLTKSAVSQHLTMLVAVGLVSVVQEDGRRVYALVPEPLQEVDDWIDQFRRFWTVYLEGLSEAMRRHRAARPRTPRGVDRP